MSDKFYRISIERLYNWIIAEEKEGRLFGLYKELLFTPQNTDRISNAALRTDF